jgi:hypothetical protein
MFPNFTRVKKSAVVYSGHLHLQPFTNSPFHFLTIAESTLKQRLESRRFHNNEEVEMAACELLQMQQSDFYLDGIFTLSACLHEMDSGNIACLIYQKYSDNTCSVTCLTAQDPIMERIKCYHLKRSKNV